MRHLSAVALLAALALYGCKRHGSQRKPCAKLDYCGCIARKDCRPRAKGCLCPCEHKCPGFEHCNCACGGGKFLGCEPRTKRRPMRAAPTRATPRPPAARPADRPTAAGPCRRPPPPGLVSLRTVPGIRLDVRYHTNKNFTGRPLPGYGAPEAWLVAPAAKALAQVQRDLVKQGLGLWVFDAYRPQRATRAMVAWAKRVNPALVGPYIAARSRHNVGVAVDLTLYKQATGKPLDMGSPYDEFTPRSHTVNGRGSAQENRQKLKRALAKRGFEPYPQEWWHFSFPGTYPALDTPYGCDD